MAVSYTCPNPDCGATLKTGAAVPAGRRVKCPKCDQGFVPVPEEKPAAAAAKADGGGTFKFADDGGDKKKPSAAAFNFAADPKKKPAAKKDDGAKPSSPPPPPPPPNKHADLDEDQESIKRDTGSRSRRTRSG